MYYTKERLKILIKKWDVVDINLDNLYKRNIRRNLIGNLIHDGRATKRKAFPLITKEKSAETLRIDIGQTLSWFISFGKYIIEKEE